MSTSAAGISNADLTAELLRCSELGFLPLHKYVISRLTALASDQFEIISQTYYIRWKEGSTEERQEIEKLGLLDFLEKELLLPSPLASKLADSKGKRPDSQSVAKFFKDFWNPFLDNRDSAIEELIFQEFRIPIHRYSQVANAIVRTNSIKLLSRFFPMHNPHVSIVEQSQTIEEQLALLKTAVFDASPLVRATAIEAMCFMFSVHWTIIPDNFRSEALLLLVRDLAFDVGSVNCRIAVLVGLEYLFDHCSRSRQTFKFLLPSLATLINDGKDSVRNTYLDLLISVHSVFPDLHLPPTETLIACLESSSPSVSRRVGVLLLDTYFPLSQSLQVKRQKFQDLKYFGAAAALKFYSNLPGYLTKTSSSRETLSNFICLLLSAEVPDVLTLEIVAVLLGAIKPHLKSKSCSGLSKVLGTGAIKSMIDQFSGRLPEMSAIFDIIAAYPSTDSSLNKKLLNSVAPLLEASESISGVFEFLSHSKQLDGYVTKVMDEFIGLLSKKFECSERPRKRARLPTTSISATLKQIQSISLHPLALATLIEHRKFETLRCLLFKCVENIKSTPEEILTSENQYLIDSTELMLRFCPLALEHRLCKDGSDQESSFHEKKEVAKLVLDLANVLLPHSSGRSTIGMATLETCLRLAPDMAMVGFLDSSLLLSYIRTFAFNRSFKGIEAHVQQAKLLDQATQLMEIYSRERSLENNSDYVQELISAVSQGIEYLFEVAPKFSTQGRKLLLNIRPLVQTMVHLTLKRDQHSEYPAMLIGCLLGCLDVKSGDSATRLAADILVSALDSKLNIETAQTVEMILPRMNSFCSLSDVNAKILHLMASFETSKFLKLCHEAVKALQAQPPPQNDHDEGFIEVERGEIRGYLCPCGCHRFATLSGEILYWDSDDVE